MYQFSRAIYRELAADIDDGRYADVATSRCFAACEATVERLVGDRHYFARPARTLFNDIRLYFPMTRPAARLARRAALRGTAPSECLDRMPQNGFDVHGQPLQCRATTRSGTPCQRMPLPHNGYCPSHQHLAETEEIELAAPRRCARAAARRSAPQARPASRGRRRLASAPMLLGVDVGGTFTDAVLVDRRAVVHTAKAPTTPDDQSRGVMAAVERALERAGAAAARRRARSPTA